MDLRKIKKLIDLLEESNLAEIEIKEGEESVRLARTPRGVQMAAPQMQAMPMHAPLALRHPLVIAARAIRKKSTPQHYLPCYTGRNHLASMHQHVLYKIHRLQDSYRDLV